ncbi:MAG TPA: hypothetical protein IAA48_08915, partial [Candidatus Eubacterium faecipullorum]|nr:hypothetical protein [Candidatus Eubacterium faecipullorum]
MQGDSLASFSKRKSAQNQHRFRSAIFYGADFSSGKAQNAVNPFGLTSILTKHEGKSAHKKQFRIYLS